jgi:hypothetical protein
MVILLLTHWLKCVSWNLARALLTDAIPFHTSCFTQNVGVEALQQVASFGYQGVPRELPWTSFPATLQSLCATSQRRKWYWAA